MLTSLKKAKGVVSYKLYLRNELDGYDQLVIIYCGYRKTGIPCDCLMIFFSHSHDYHWVIAMISTRMIIVIIAQNIIT